MTAGGRQSEAGPPGASGVASPARPATVSPMFAKLLAIVVALILVGAALLAIRHQRLETMHRIAAAREAIDRELARQRTLAARIAELAEAERVARLARELDVGPWTPRPERAVPADELVHAARVAEQRERTRADEPRPRFGPPVLVDAGDTAPAPPATAAPDDARERTP